MGDFNGIKDASKFFEGDLYAMNSGIVIEEMDEATCVCSMKVTRDHRNALGGIMGGAIFTLADFASSVVANNLHKHTVAQQANINFLSNTMDDMLYAYVSCVKNGRTSCVTNIDIKDSKGKHIARTTITGYKLPKKQG